MSDWIGSARSNYFRVKDVEEFKGLCLKWNCTFISHEDDFVGFLCEEGGLPSFAVIEEDGNEIELDFDNFLKELSEHLLPGDVAIMMEIGAEKLRYITGVAIAVNSKNEQRTVNLTDIYKVAKEIGTGITYVEY